MTKKNKLKIYYAWIDSIIRYGIETYGFAKQVHINTLQRTQNKILKILFKNDDDERTCDIFTRTKILNVRQLRDYCILVNNYYSTKYKIANVIKTDLLRKTTYRYEIPKIKNDYGKNTRNYYVPAAFNKVPNSLLGLSSNKLVRKELKNFILMKTNEGLF